MPRDYSEYEYDDELPETYRNPLKPFLIALVVLLLLFAAIIVLLFMRLQTANTRADTLSQELTAVQVQLDDLRAQQAAETPTPTPTEEPTPGCNSQAYVRKDRTTGSHRFACAESFFGHWNDPYRCLCYPGRNHLRRACGDLLFSKEEKVNF